MRRINKPNEVPVKLVEVQDAIAQDLYEKKDRFRWSTNHYSDPIKDDLEILYHNKCGFCETKLTKMDADNKFTVEHFRPKAHYYWLGAEWTNLFPACTKCNGIKDNDFPLMVERLRIQKANAPFGANEKLVDANCKADHDDYLNEKTLLIHPEVDTPENYFRIESSGKAVIKDGLDKYQEAQARYMLLKFINRPTVEEGRGLKILEYQRRLRKILKNALVSLGENYTERDISLLFLDFFTDLDAQRQLDAEFSLLGVYMFEQFDVFFLNKIEEVSGEDMRNLVAYAYQIYNKNKAEA